MKKKLSVVIAIISIVSLLFVLVACDNNNGNTTPSGQPSGEISSGSSGEVTPSGDVPSGSISSGDLSSGEINSGEISSGEIGSGEAGSGDEDIYPDGTLVINGAYQPPQIDDSGVNYNEAFVIDGTTITGLTTYGKTLQKLVVPDGITAIGNNAFAFGMEDMAEMFDSFLKVIELPSSVTSIGDQAFAGNLLLTSIVLPNNLQSIGSEAFACCASLAELELPDSITSIGDNAFFNTTSLVIKCKSQQIISQMSDKFVWCDEPEGKIPVISDYLSCVANDGYTYVVGSDGIQYALKDGKAKITGHAFIEGEIELVKNIVYNGQTYELTGLGAGAFGYASKITSIKFSDTIKSIEMSAFGLCVELAEIILNNGLTSIGDMSFASCDKLTAIVIPNTVIDMGSYVFTSNPSLTIYCEAESQPSGWYDAWNPDNNTVEWGYKVS